MRVCVHLRDPAGVDLRGGNFRSEPRWERLALEACISNNMINELYTSGYEWVGGSSVSEKYKGKIDSNSSKGAILIAQDWNRSTLDGMNYKAALLNIFLGPWDNQIEEITNIRNKLGGHLYFMVGHPSLYRGEMVDSKNTCSHLEKFVPVDNIIPIPLPWIPENCFGDRFLNKSLFWTSRIVFVQQMVESGTIMWALDKLCKDCSLNLRILVGWNPNEVKDLVNGNVVMISEDINDYVWKQQIFTKYKSVRNRVRVLYGMEWREILKENELAKLMITHARHYGGPPMEAAMYGVPFVGTTKDTGALVDCEDYLFTHSEEEACTILDRLMDDREFYGNIAKSYNNYAVSTYSFSNFNNNINKFLTSKGLI